MDSFTIKKLLNNNVLIAVHALYGEVVLIGKGLGFGKKHGDLIKSNSYEKMFVLKNETEQEQYKKLLPFIEEEFVEIMNDVIYLIKENVNVSVDEHIHIALTDHISFAIKRLKQGIDLKNPFLMETKTLYPLEYKVAEKVVRLLNKTIDVHLPEGEIGFIALHIHSAISKNSISEINHDSHLINTLVSLVEDSLKIKLDRESIAYLRLARHIQHTIKRVKCGDIVKEPKELANLLKQEYPICYNLSWKAIKVMQQTLKTPVNDAEVVYLTMHLQRLVNKTE